MEAGAKAEGTEEVGGNQGGEDGEDAETTRGLDPKFESQLEAMRQEREEVTTELETSEQERAEAIKDRAMAEDGGWIKQKVQFSEIAAQTKDETERKRWAAEFS